MLSYWWLGWPRFSQGSGPGEGSGHMPRHSKAFTAFMLVMLVEHHGTSWNIVEHRGAWWSMVERGGASYNVDVIGYLLALFFECN